ncbi:hypothetical protein [Chryseobacterium sp. MEBOG07]|uniref:hypothetical protein n=1 Tax=Chryseobacterium sp. MEBOG07 TaxID=2879939 RepID=UPI001F47CE76|nr:hypothetical protein [Chryseobacterium sp. MEBOG07]UKB78571.1 hypothetical protein LF886_19185 [Chryseobacterium sp. MEBOG07]
MTSFPFSPLGVDTILNQLYGLTNAALSTQAKAIKLDFKGWMKDHFTLTENQLTFLAAIKEEASVYYGEQCSFCFLHRLEIKLVSPIPPEVSRYAKWIGSSSTISIKSDGTGESVISGMLTFTISYQ